MFDYLIVGAGFAGSVMAERLHNKGSKVLIIEERGHIAGNAYDYYNEEGILISSFSGHFFHCNSKDVWDYLSLFTEWHPYEHKVLGSIDGQLLPIPINLNTINKLFGINLNQEEAKEFLKELVKKVPIEALREHNSCTVIVKQVGIELYEKVFKGYTTKQWGLKPEELSASVCGRIPVRTNYDNRYFTDTYQAMPLNGYTKMFENILKGIPIILNYSYEEALEEIKFDKLIYTGPIDRYYDYKLGKLPYRSLRLEFKTLDKEYHLPLAQVNYPNTNDYTRIMEFKHATGQKHDKTTIVYEYPCENDKEPYYPIPTEENQELYKKYKMLSNTKGEQKVFFTGRLGTYKYLNMDAVVAQSLKLFKDIK